MDAAEFDACLARAGTPEDRLAWFGALLAKEVRSHVELVGGSAIEIYLSSSAYVSQDVDVVGERFAIGDVLRRWGFREVTGRSQRLYWFKETVGLVDLVGAVARSGMPARRIETPYGPVLLSAVEPLIIRRLVRAARESSRELFRQAVALARLGGLDWEYLEAEARYEKVAPSLQRLRTQIRARTKPKERSTRLGGSNR